MCKTQNEEIVYCMDYITSQDLYERELQYAMQDISIQNIQYLAEAGKIKEFLQFYLQYSEYKIEFLEYFEITVLDHANLESVCKDTVLRRFLCANYKSFILLEITDSELT